MLVEMFSVIITVHTNLRQIQPVICRDDGDIPAVFAQSLRNRLGDESFPAGVNAAYSNKQSLLWRKRFSFLDDRRNYRTIFEHELQPGSAIKAGSDLRGARPLPTLATLRGRSARRRSCSSAIQLAAVRH